MRSLPQVLFLLVLRIFRLDFTIRNLFSASLRQFFIDPVCQIFFLQDILVRSCQTPVCVRGIFFARTVSGPPPLPLFSSAVSVLRTRVGSSPFILRSPRRTPSGQPLPRRLCCFPPAVENYPPLSYFWTHRCRVFGNCTCPRFSASPSPLRAKHTSTSDIPPVRDLSPSPPCRLKVFSFPP